LVRKKVIVQEEGELMVCYRRAKVVEVDEATHVTTDTSDFWVALRIEIGLATTLLFLTCVFAYLCRRLLLQASPKSITNLIDILILLVLAAA
jgi:hypothetical protein